MLCGKPLLTPGPELLQSGIMYSEACAASQDFVLTVHLNVLLAANTCRSKPVTTFKKTLSAQLATAPSQAQQPSAPTLPTIKQIAVVRTRPHVKTSAQQPRLLRHTLTVIKSHKEDGHMTAAKTPTLHQTAAR